MGAQKQFDEAAVLLKRNRKNAVVKFKNNNYHLSGVLKCKECGGNFRGIMSITNHRTKVKRPWYRCSSKGVSYLKCNNASVSADVIGKQVWDIIDVVRQNVYVIE